MKDIFEIFHNFFKKTLSENQWDFPPFLTIDFYKLQHDINLPYHIFNCISIKQVFSLALISSLP
jgi:hypothetical protein